MRKFWNQLFLAAVLLMIFFSLTGCNQPRDFNITPTNDGSESVATDIFMEATQTQTVKTQTATAVPLALTVNGVGYPLAEFTNDLMRFMMVHADMDPQEAFSQLTNDLSEQLLLQQAAVKNGFLITEDQVDQRINNLANEVGGRENLDNWISNNYYSESSFRVALIREIAIAYQKEIILEEIPDEIDQVELYQILVYDEGTAKQIAQALEEGSDFFWLAEQYHPATLGYIGWNPKGAMLPPEMEETAFQMESGTYSEIIQTDFGYHIIYVNAHESHEISLENLRFLQESALQNWMEDQKQSANIEIFATYDQ